MPAIAAAEVVEPLTSLLTRYRDHGENMERAAIFNDGKHLHTHLGTMLSDDIVILAKAKNGACWWFFWYDRDVSDCFIGRFETKDADETVKANFAEYAEGISLDASSCPAIPLRADAFRSWISF